MESLEKKLRTIRSFALAGALAVGSVYATGCEEESQCCQHLTQDNECDEMVAEDYVCEDVGGNGTAENTGMERFEEYYCYMNEDKDEDGNSTGWTKEYCCACVKD